MIASYDGDMYRTANGGTTWLKASSTPASPAHMNAVALSSVTAGWAVGDGGALWRTTNGGDTWTKKPTSPTTRGLTAIELSGSRGIAVGSVGTVLVTDDGGDNWRLAGSGPPPTDTVTAAIDSVTPNPASYLETVTFTGHGTDSLGHGITAYEWKEGATVLSTAASFTKSNLSVGPHTIAFRVKCSNNTWSSPVSTDVVVSANNAPVAVADSYSTPEDTPKVVSAPGVLSNDTDADGDPRTAVKVTNPSHGVVAMSANGGFTYTPASDWNGMDSFTYRAYDGTAYSNTVTVSINVTAVNDTPVAVGDSYSTTEGTALTVPAAGVLANDTDADADSLTANLVSDVSHGTLTLSSAGSLLYTPDAGWLGADSFTYRAYDGAAYSNTVTVSLDVTVANAKSRFSYLSGYQRLSYGRTAGFSGVLKSGDTPLEGQTVVLQRLSGRTSGSWIDVTSADTNENGYVRFSVPANSSGYNYTKTYYRLLFAGATGYDGVWTVSRYVDPKVYLSRPWPHKSRVYRKRTYSWYANLKPRHSGKPVKMYFQRYYKGKWRHYRTRYASAYNYSSYSRVKARYAIPYKGRWRVRAYHDDGGHLPTYSSWRYVTVR